MIDIKRDIQGLYFTIGCADKTGRLLAALILKGKNEIEYKKALIETLLLLGLLPMPLLSKTIYITDKRETNDHTLEVTCPFNKAAKTITELAKAFTHPLTPYLMLDLLVKPETIMSTYKYCVNCEKDHDTEYSLLAKAKEPVIVIYQ